MRFRNYLSVFLAALLMFAAAVPASADVLFTRQATYSDPVALGIIAGDGAPFSPLQSNLGGNQGNRIFPFLDADGNLRIALTFYGGVGQGSADTIRIFDPGARSNWAMPSNWNTPLASVSSSTQNVRALATIGSYMYTTGYDKAIISRVVMVNNAYTESKVWQHPEINGKHGEGLFAYNGYLYAIITDTTGDPMQPDVAYGPNQIWKFDRDLNVIDHAKMIGRNMDGQNGGVYVRRGNKLYVCSFGGYQETGGGYNGKTTIEVCDLDTLECTQLALGSDVQEKTGGEWQYMFSGLAFVNDKVYVHGTTWTVVNGEQGNHEMAVYETTEERLLAGDIGERIGLFNGNYGVQMGFTYDPDTGYLWAREGNSLQRLNEDGTWTKFSAADLKGSLTDVAPIAVTTESGEAVVIPSTVTVEPSDISSDAGTVTSASPNEDAPAALSSVLADGNYGTLIENGGEFANLTHLCSITLKLEYEGVESATFSIENFDYAPAEGERLVALMRKKSGLGSTYYQFPCTLDANGTLTFTVSPLSDYFTKNTVTIAAATVPDEGEDYTYTGGGDASGTSGCSGGLGAAALLAFPPLLMVRGRKKD